MNQMSWLKMADVTMTEKFAAHEIAGWATEKQC